jgi:hypothetical protein
VLLPARCQLVAIIIAAGLPWPAHGGRRVTARHWAWRFLPLLASPVQGSPAGHGPVPRDCAGPALERPRPAPPPVPPPLSPPCRAVLQNTLDMAKVQGAGPLLLLAGAEVVAAAEVAQGKEKRKRGYPEPCAVVTGRPCQAEGPQAAAGKPCRRPASCTACPALMRACCVVRAGRLLPSPAQKLHRDCARALL